MGLFDKVSDFMKREADDIGEMAGDARDRLDAELSQREAELEMTPVEKMRAIQAETAESDDRIEQIMDKAQGQGAAASAEAEVEAAHRAQAHAAAAAANEGIEAPAVTQITLADGSVRSGNDLVVEDEDDAEPEVVEPPDAGDLAWVAPRAGEEAIVPAFNVKVGAIDGSGPMGASDDAEAGSDDEPEVETQVAADHQNPAASETDEPQSSAETDLAPTAVEPAAVEPADDAVDTAPVAEAEPEGDPDLSHLPPPPPAPGDDPAIDGSPADQPPADEAAAERPEDHEPVEPDETPAEIAARVVANLDDPITSPASEAGAPAETPSPAATPAASAPPVRRPEPTFEKTPAQIKYELARQAADELLEELRGELRDDGAI